MTEGLTWEAIAVVVAVALALLGALTWLMQMVFVLRYNHIPHLEIELKRLHGRLDNWRKLWLDHEGRLEKLEDKEGG